MPIDTNSIKNELYTFLKGQGLRPTRYTSDWNKTQVSDEADIFQVKFQKDGVDYGTFQILVDGVKKVIVFYDREIANSPSGGEGLSWTNLVKRLKKFAMNQQLSFELDDQSNLEDVVKKRNHDNKKQLEEGYYGTRNTSYTDRQPGNIKIILKHSKPISEGEQRFRNISKIFLENEIGERVLAPTTRPSVARAFAQCLAQGNEVNGVHWKHITEMADDVTKLSAFLRATRNKQLNENTTRLVNEAQSYYDSVRGTIKQLQSNRGYNSYFDSWKPQLNETEDSADVVEMFRNNTIDPRIENALPILNRLNKNIMEMSEVDELSAWADSIVNETVNLATKNNEQDLVDLIGQDSDFFNLGVSGKNAIGQLIGLIDNEDLYDRLRKAAAANPDGDARPIIIAWMSEHAGDESFSNVLKQIQSEEEPEAKAKPAAPAPAPKAKPEAKPTGDTPPPPLEEDQKLSSDEDLWDLGGSKQEFDSAETSINKEKLPATFGTIDKKKMVDPKGKIIADIGGGKFDNAVKWAQERDGKLYVYDPFNRSAEHNQEVIGKIAGGKADIATVNNVLNVIKEPEARARVIRQAANVVKPGGMAYFLIYEGDKSGEGKDKGKGRWQNNLPTRAYVDEIAQFFDDVKIKHGLIVATKGGLNENEPDTSDDEERDWDAEEEYHHYGGYHPDRPDDWINEASKDKKNIVPQTTPRNFVAKNAQTSGAGRHTKQNEYQRKEKHPQRELRRMEVTESALDKLKRLSGLK